MKHVKKLASVLLAMVMVMAMTMTAFAATITITGGANGSEYSAYKLLSATDGSSGDEAKFSYTVNSKYQTILQRVVKDAKEVETTPTDAEIIDYIGSLDADGIRTFADDVYAAIKAEDLTVDMTTTNGIFEDAAQGYYLIAETKVGNNADTYSLVMLDTAGNSDIEVATKEDIPTVEKKLKETNDSTGTTTNWQDGADYDIGDEIPFQLTGTVSSKIADYETYYYEFHDTMSKGLTLKTDEEGKYDIKVTIDGTDVTSKFVTTVTKNEDGTTSLSIKCVDIKSIGVAVNADSKIVVTYTAILNGDAVIGSTGNPNEVYLEYSNNPYDEGDGEDKPETGKTPEDTVIVFTYKLDVNKVDKDGEPLSGAGFTLYKLDAESNAWVKVGDEITNTTTFSFTGLDAGKYKLEETTVPAGYNKAEDLIFVVEGVYKDDMGAGVGEAPTLTDLVVKNVEGDTISAYNIDEEDVESGKIFIATLNAGTVSTDVENLSGTELPETGGMGTTIFYVIGSILVLGAAVVMITRKRMAK